MTVAFISTTVFFVGVTVATLYHQRWARRLPALDTLTARQRAGRRSALLCDRGCA